MGGIRRRRRAAPTPLTQQIVDSANAPPEKAEVRFGPDPEKITPDRLIPSGVTLVNCACSDDFRGAFALGSINTIPGKTASGKTEFMLNILASCAKDSRFSNHELVYDDAEWAMSFDLPYLFPPLVDRMIAPAYEKKDLPVYSETIQDFEGNMLIRCKSGKPFIYVLDSLDGLSSTQEVDREYKNALKKAKSDKAVEELKKSFGTENARVIRATLRMIDGMIKKGDSILFIVQQTRQNMQRGAGQFGIPDWITAGGTGPEFFSFHRIYFSSTGTIKGEAKNLKHVIGGHTIAEVTKNKLNGKKRKVAFDIYEDLGVDDVSSCVDFLKTTGEWYVDGSYMKAPGILGNDKKMYRSDLIRYIEKEGAIPELQALVGKVWNEAEDEMRLKDRARRF